MTICQPLGKSDDMSSETCIGSEATSICMVYVLILLSLNPDHWYYPPTLSSLKLLILMEQLVIYQPRRWSP